MKNNALYLIFLSLILISCSASNGAERLFTGNPEQLVCQEADLPGSYILIENESGARPNEALIINKDQPAATNQYITTTGRISGWEHRFILIEPTRTLPGFILCQVVIFETLEGANQALRWPTEEARNIEVTDRSIGDDLIMTVVEFSAPDGSPWKDYRIEFSYQNLLASVSTFSPKEIANPDYALDLADILHQRMSDAISNN